MASASSADTTTQNTVAGPSAGSTAWLNTRTLAQSAKLADVLYEIRVPVNAEAQRMELALAATQALRSELDEALAEVRPVDGGRGALELERPDHAGPA